MRSAHKWADTVSQRCREELHKSSRMAILYEHKPESLISALRLSLNRLIKICVTFFPWKYGSFALSWQSRPQIALCCGGRSAAGVCFRLSEHTVCVRGSFPKMLLSRERAVHASHMLDLCALCRGYCVQGWALPSFGQLRSFRPLIGSDFWVTIPLADASFKAPHPPTSSPHVTLFMISLQCEVWVKDSSVWIPKMSTGLGAFLGFVVHQSSSDT